MHMKMNWKKAVKIAAALVLALAVLDLFCFWYYNPAEYDWDESRATDTIREPGAFTSRATEGIAWAAMDANGYNNPEAPGEDGVFVLMMGSSHTEGLNVMQHETAASRLQEKLGARGVEGRVYNIGISAHDLTRNAANFERALDRFGPSGYVVLETQHVKFNKSAIEAAMSDSFTRYAATEPVISEWISDRPLLRTLYRQWESFFLEGGEDGEAASAEIITEEMLDQYQQAMTDLLLKLREAALAQGSELIICYHPHLLLGEDGGASSDADAGCHAAFTAACADAGVPFLDMTETFMQAYAEQSILPHGFANTAPGAGHLNPAGHDMIAEALCEMILEREAMK